MTTFNQVFQAANNAVSVNNLDWIFSEDSADKSLKVDPLIEYQFDPLAFALSAMAKQKHLSEIHTLLSASPDITKEYYIKEQESIVADIDQFQESSNTIRRFFKNRLLMLRLKNQQISRYRTNLEEVLENPQQLKKSQIPILVKLPDFYREDQETETLFKQYQSVSGTVRQESVDEPFEYVTKIERNSSKNKAFRYYFVNQKQELLTMSFKQTDRINNFINYFIRKNQPVIIKGSCMIKHQPGYDNFLLYSDGNFEFYDV